MIEHGQIRFGNTDIEYTVIRSRRRRKTIEITLDPGQGVLVAVPMATTKEQISGVVKKRAAWIVRQATAAMLCPRPKAFVSGESLPYLGRQAPLFIEYTDRARVSVAFEHWSFHIAAPARLTGDERRQAIERAMVRWYKSRAAERLADRVQYWQTRTDSAPRAILIRDQRRRWGSCSPDGTLRFNWRLVMAPPALIDYVLVHELVHLRVKNHSSTFWGEVASLLPDYKLCRARLKELGPSLTM